MDGEGRASCSASCPGRSAGEAHDRREVISRTWLIAVTASILIASAAVWAGSQQDGRAASASPVSGPQSRQLVTVRNPGCKSAQRAIRYYKLRTHQSQRERNRLTWQHGLAERIKWPTCDRARSAAEQWHDRAEGARESLAEWVAYHYDWSSWLPAKWQRIGACETGYGQTPGNWRHSNSRYEGAFGFAKSSWDSFKGRADRRAGPYPEDAWQATPRQQYEVALAIWREYGLSGWGCRGA